MSQDTLGLAILLLGFPGFILLVVWVAVIRPRRQSRQIASRASDLAPLLGMEVLEQDRIGGWDERGRYHEVRWRQRLSHQSTPSQTVCERLLKPECDVPFGVTLVQSSFSSEPSVRVVSEHPAAPAVVDSVSRALLAAYPFELLEWLHVDVDRQRLRVVLRNLVFGAERIRAALRCADGLAERVEQVFAPTRPDRPET